VRTAIFLGIWVLVSIVACNALAGSQRETVPVVDSGETLVFASLRKHSVKITIKTARILGRMPYLDEEDLTRNLRPIVIEMIHIEVDGKPLFVSPSVFVDLVDPHKVRIGLESKYMVLSIFGGDAADSYITRVYFDSKAVRRRTLSSAIPPATVAEETRYWLRTLRDE
jgi:hypothetical protein